jgi:hypothetical protein
MVVSFMEGVMLSCMLVTLASGADRKSKALPGPRRIAR